MMHMRPFFIYLSILIYLYILELFGRKHINMAMADLYSNKKRFSPSKVKETKRPPRLDE